MNTNFCHDNTADGVRVGKNIQHDFYIQIYINKITELTKISWNYKYNSVIVIITSLKMMWIKYAQFYMYSKQPT